MQEDLLHKFTRKIYSSFIRLKFQTHFLALIWPRLPLHSTPPITTTILFIHFWLQISNWSKIWVYIIIAGPSQITIHSINLDSLKHAAKINHKQPRLLSDKNESQALYELNYIKCFLWGAGVEKKYIQGRIVRKCKADRCRLAQNTLITYILGSYIYNWAEYTNSRIRPKLDWILIPAIHILIPKQDTLTCSWSRESHFFLQVIFPNWMAL